MSKDVFFQTRKCFAKFLDRRTKWKCFYFRSQNDLLKFDFLRLKSLGGCMGVKLISESPFEELAHIG